MSAQRVDELYPSLHPTLGRGSYMSSSKFVQIASPTMRAGLSSSRAPLEVDFGELIGLVGDLRIKWQSNNVDFPRRILELAMQARSFQNLPENWDSYGGLPLAADCVRPAFEVILELHRRGLSPEMVLLGSGGIGLRWVNGPKRLEIDFEPDGTCEALLLDDLSAEPSTEFEGEANVNSLTPILAAFRKQ
jgi:hypothetical protein